jgi:hypothetical protein
MRLNAGMATQTEGHRLERNASLRPQHFGFAWRIGSPYAGRFL